MEEEREPSMRRYGGLRYLPEEQNGKSHFGHTCLVHLRDDKGVSKATV
jgi:hypothetical protein